MIKLKIDKENLIELLKNFLCIFDKSYNKNRMITLEYNMDVFILAKVMEMNETEKECFVFEDGYNGIRAGAAAGCTTVMIPDTLAPTEEMQTLSAAIYANLHEALAQIQQNKL